MFPTVLYLVLQIPAVQTQIVKRIANHFSSELKSTISVGRIDFKFFNKLSLSNILIKDKNNDTLLFSRKLTAGIRKIDLKNKDFGLGRVDIIDPVIELITDSTGQMNLSWFLNQLKNPPDTIKKAAGKFSIARIDISHARFSFSNHSDTGKKSKAKLNFKNLNINDLNSTIEDLNIFNDTTSFNIYNLSLKEENGFAIRKMSSSVLLSGKKILLGSMFLHTDSSVLNFDKISLAADSSSSFSNFISGVKLDINIEKSLLKSSDLGYFLPVPDDINESLSFSGRFTGTISELRGRNVNIAYRDHTSLDCDFDLSGLPEIENAFIYIGVNSFKTKAEDIGKINIPGKGKITLPAVAYRLGDISFDGSFTGFTTDFVTYGEFRTSQGTIRTDISLRPEKSNRYRMKGLLRGININLGELSGSDLLGKLSIQANVDGYASSLKKFAGNLSGKIDSIEINNYNYRSIALNGFFTEKTWDGSINIEDKNIKLDLMGMFNFSEALPEFNFTMNLTEADLYRLNIDKADTTSSLSLLLTSNFRGNNIDNLDGEIKLLNSTIIKHNKTIDLYDFSVRTYTENEEPALSIRTDFVDADIKGYYNFAGLKNLVKSSLASMMPSLFQAIPENEELKQNNFSFNINFKNTDKINDLFRTGILLAENSYIRGSVLPDTVLKIDGSSPALSIKNIIFSDFSFSANTSGSKINADVKSSLLLLPGNTELKNFSIGLNTNPDKFIFTVDWDNKEDILEKGNITARGSIAESKRGLGRPYLKIDIDSTQIYTSDNPWKISQSSIRVDSNAISIDNINISSSNRFYHIYGSVSEDPADTLHLQFKGIDISPLNYLGTKSENIDTGRIKMDLKGILNGNIGITNVYKNLLLESDIMINDFSILGSEYGDVSIGSEYNYLRKVVEIKAGNNLEGKEMFNIKGFYDPSPRKINIDFVARRLPVEALNPLLRSFASGITGFASGKVNLSGKPDDLILHGSVLAESVNMKINYLQTYYKMNDSIRFDRNGIKFNNVRFSDAEGKPGTISGFVNHKNFKNYVTDLTINMGNDFLVLNTQPKDNPMFYGKVYASGVTKIKTGPNSLSFDISAKTGKNSKFFIPLTNELSVTQSSFISFIDSTDQSGKDKMKPPPEAPKQLGLDLNIDLTVTPDAVAELIFDPTVGDKMTGSGSGILNINLDPKGNFRITGDYNIEKGDYLFTLKNILNKKFEIENGGRISFNGDLHDAEVDLRAIYQKFTTSLYPILELDEKVAVEPQLLLTGNLFNPTVNFEINLPNADEDRKTYLRNAISTEEELSRQFLYLLVMKSFYSEQASSPTGSSNSTGTSAMAVTTTEMLSNQLSNWISQISNDFNLGFTYRPGSGDKAINPDELKIAFETQVLDNRVILNGNLDYSNSLGNTDQLTGDFDAEFKITDKVRFKVFNRFNETYSGKGPYTQGIGIFFKEDFAKLSDLFKKRTKSSMKKEEEVTLKNP